MRKQIRSILYSIGISRCYLGAYYFTEAIFMAIEDPEKLSSIRKEIYLPVAIKYNTSLVNVERNIRYVRDLMLKDASRESLEKIAGYKIYHDTKLSPKEVIEMFATYLSREKE